MRLEGQRALVTGGSRSIGRGISLGLAREGADVAVNFKSSREDAESAVREIEELGRRAVAVRGSTDSSSDVERFVDEARDFLGGIDILVNNAGASAAGPFERVTDEGWHDDLELKLYGAIRACRLALPHMRAQGGGRIINVTNLGAKAPGAASVPTSVSRAAGVALTKAMSKEFAADNILVNTVCIGLIKSAQWERRYELAQAQDASVTQDSIYASMGQNVPLKRVGESEEAGDVIAFLASERASYLTGIAVNIDGGTSPVV